MENIKEIEIHPYLSLHGLNIQLEIQNQEIEKLDFKAGGIWFNNTRTIVCGTFPPKGEYLGRKGYVHFSSSRNQFWKHFDMVFDTAFFQIFRNRGEDMQRIENAKAKINFCKTKRIGFIDLFTKISRTKNTAKDIDLIALESIFEIGVFDEILKSDVIQILFVYSLSRDAFMKALLSKYTCSTIMLKPYGSEGISLEIRKIVIEGKQLLISYCPIHGNISWAKKQIAMKAAFEFTYNK